MVRKRVVSLTVMRALGFGIVVAMLGLAACATARPPGTRVTDVGRLAGTYTGTLEEIRMTDRPVRMVFLPDGSFEITAGDPGGFRFNGRVLADADGNLVYVYDDDRNKGRGVVYEAEGRRVIVLDRADGRATITVSKSLP
jgi:hypothetical protein